MSIAPRKRATLKDIAESLKVSTTTVYRALNDYPDISQKLKDQILFIANELHYHPNFYASNLRKKQSGIIGVVIPKLTHWYSSTLISGIIKVAREKGFQTIVCETRNDLEEERKSLATLVNVGVDGILLAVSNNTLDEEHLAHLHEENIPFVFFDKVPESISGPKVLTNDYKGAFMATEHLIKQKYTRIAHIKGQQGSRNALPRFMGYTDALAKHRHVFNAAYVKQCKHASEEEGYKFTNDLLRMKQRPDAFFTVNDETAIGVITALRKHKISIPDEVGVVGYCNSKTGMYMQPSLTSVEQYGNDIGSRSAEILADMIMGKAGEDVMSKQIILEPRLVIRDSSKRH